MKRLVSTLALSALILVPAVAYAADTAGEVGTPAAMRVNAPTSTTYASYHGSITITGSRTQEYRWGGTSCGSLTLSTENVALLQDAVRNNLSVTPYYQTGQGTTRCLVGFGTAAASSSGGGGKGGK